MKASAFGNDNFGISPESTSSEGKLQEAQNLIKSKLRDTEAARSKKGILDVMTK
jgi:hypothetical protein